MMDITSICMNNGINLNSVSNHSLAMMNLQKPDIRKSGESSNVVSISKSSKNTYSKFNSTYGEISNILNGSDFNEVRTKQ